ncbi:hypothetical protein IWQ60_001543 [Tieghemiomyces parasiticus]|uniref:N-acetyltransferase domain-containing protein n=1 Tax=Tieghemiomyces parasiticus TaxID=78921 RepID=A0A9W8AEF4_9FUNG|nr:hypothetical protein IWQ60_001543 [Tieghemiomyces parasiticus]
MPSSTTLSTPPLTVRLTESRAEVDSCRALRRAVFVDEGGFDLTSENDGVDVRALHLIAITIAQSHGSDGRSSSDLSDPASADQDGDQATPDDSPLPIGTLRIFETLDGNPWVQVGKVAVRRTHRSLGIGRLLMHEAERVIMDRFPQHEAIVLDAVARQAPFYTKMGYVVDAERGVYLKKGAPHVRMSKLLRPV